MGARLGQETGPPSSCRNGFSLATGMVAAVLGLGVAVVLGDAPAADATGETLLAWATARREAVLASTPVWTVSVAAIYAFSLSVGADLLARASSPMERTLVVLGAVSSLLTFGISLIGFLFLTALAYQAPNLSAESAHGLGALSLLSVNLTGIPTALTLLPWGWGMYRNRLASPALIGFGVAVACLHVVSACAFASSGWLSPSGIGARVAPPLYYVWVVWLGMTKFAPRVPSTGHARSAPHGQTTGQQQRPGPLP